MTTTTKCQQSHPNWCIDGPHLCPPGCTDCPFTVWNDTDEWDEFMDEVEDLDL